MHDWTLVSISFTWKPGTVRLVFRDPSSQVVTLVGEDVRSLRIPRIQEWGSSESVNEVLGPMDVGNLKQLSVEIQSGDVLEVTACSFHTEKEIWASCGEEGGESRFPMSAVCILLHCLRRQSPLEEKDED